MAEMEIEEIKEQFVKALSPVRIYLFGSFAAGTNTDESDYDFYIVLNDSTRDLAEASANAYRSIRHVKKRPVDIVVGTDSRFEERKLQPTIENEVFTKGVLLYGN